MGSRELITRQLEMERKTPSGNEDASPLLADIVSGGDVFFGSYIDNGFDNLVIRALTELLS